MRRLAGILSEQQRGDELVARYGGDEFAILFPATTGEQAQERIMAFREALASPASFAMPGGDLPLPRISIGLATLGADADTALGLVACADSRMYDQKAQLRALRV